MKLESISPSQNEVSSFKEYRESWSKDEVEYSKCVKQMPLKEGSEVYIIEETIQGPSNKKPVLEEGWEDKNYGSDYFYYCRNYATLTDPRYENIISKFKG